MTKSGEVSRERREVYIILRISDGSSKKGEGSEVVVDTAASDEVLSLFSIEVSPMAPAGFPITVGEEEEVVVVVVTADMFGRCNTSSFRQKGFFEFYDMTRNDNKKRTQDGAGGGRGDDI